MKWHLAFSRLFFTCLSMIGTFSFVDSAHADEEKTILIRPFIKAGWFQAVLDADEEEIEYVPNPMMCMGAKIGYKKLTASLAFRVARLEDKEIAANATDFNVEISYPFQVVERELVANAFFHTQKNLSTPTSEGDFHLNDGMDAIDVGIDLVLYLNKSFSFKKVMDELEPRAGSSGSWLVRTSVGMMYLGFIEESPDDIFIPSGMAASVDEFIDLKLIRDTYISVSGGYVYDWNFRPSLFLTVLGSFGITASHLDLSYAGGASESSWTFGPSLSFLLGLTYAGPTFHAGASVGMTQESARSGDVLIEGLRPTLLFFAGMRF